VLVMACDRSRSTRLSPKQPWYSSGSGGTRCLAGCASISYSDANKTLDYTYIVVVVVVIVVVVVCVDG
jgi:hypothetical protein